MITELAPIRRRHDEILSDPAELLRLLSVGASKAREVAETVLERASQVMGSDDQEVECGPCAWRRVREDGAVTGFPCPCCGHLTLPLGPGDHELCPVCFWEDDAGQLRYPMSPNGANGVSLIEAQQVYQRLGAVDQESKRRVRRPRADEPLDEGWRRFDPSRDWADPALDSDRWPVNSEALYYWRPTYWNGDQHKLPLPPRESTNDDRLLTHLRQGVPELEDAIAASEHRWGTARAFGICEDAATLVIAAYRRGDEQLGQRVVTALLPALDEGSTMYAPKCVCIAFLENEGWHDPAIQEYVDRWPAPIRDELRRQQAFRVQHDADVERRQEGWVELHRTARGQPVGVIVEQLRALGGHEYDHPLTELGRELTARVISNPRWLYRHPVDSLLLAWRYRALRRPWRTLAWMRRPRYVG